MNEFIVWDKRYRVFRKLLKIDFELGLYFCIDTVVPFEKGDLVNDIGLKDIKGKSIYADSSIVEFKLKDDVIFADFTSAKPTIWNEIKMIGYFVFNNEDLRYEIDIVDWEKNKTKSNFVGLYYNLATMSQFKIIDTIQENKLGLIK